MFSGKQDNLLPVWSPPQKWWASHLPAWTRVISSLSRCPPPKPPRSPVRQIAGLGPAALQRVPQPRAAQGRRNESVSDLEPRRCNSQTSPKTQNRTRESKKSRRNPEISAHIPAVFFSCAVLSRQVFSFMIKVWWVTLSCGPPAVRQYFPQLRAHS